MSKLASRLLFATALMVTMASPAIGQAGDSRIFVTTGRSQLLATEAPIERVAVSDPKVATVHVISNRQILVQGVGTGRTTLLVWVKGGAVKTYDVMVAPEAATPRREQIAIDVHVLELAKNSSLNLGITAGSGEVTEMSGGIRKYIFKPGAMDVGEQTMGNLSSISALNFLAARIDLMQRRGEAKLLARPTLVTIDGGTAKFLAGGEIPIPIQQALGTISIVWKEFGVRLEVQPSILVDGRISMTIKPEVSSLDFAGGLKMANFTIPGIRTRRAETQVMLRPDETLLLGGLMNDQKTRNRDQLPFLGDIPILGELFQSRQWQDDQTELAILVTPHLITPGPDVKPPGHLPAVKQELLQGGRQ